MNMWAIEHELFDVCNMVEKRKKKNFIAAECTTVISPFRLGRFPVLWFSAFVLSCCTGIERGECCHQKGAGYAAVHLHYAW